MNPYQKSNQIKADSMPPQKQVAFVFERITDNLEFSFRCFQDKEYEKFFNHVKKAIDLSNNLGQVINSISKDASDEQKRTMLPWVNYFESLVCGINRYSVTHSGAAKDKLVESLKAMAKMWQNALSPKQGETNQNTTPSSVDTNV